MAGLDEEVWAQADSSTSDFIQVQPNPGYPRLGAHHDQDPLRRPRAVRGGHAVGVRAGQTDRAGPGAGLLHARLGHLRRRAGHLPRQAERLPVRREPGRSGVGRADVQRSARRGHRLGRDRERAHERGRGPLDRGDGDSLRHAALQPHRGRAGVGSRLQPAHPPPERGVELGAHGAAAQALQVQPGRHAHRAPGPPGGAQRLGEALRAGLAHHRADAARGGQPGRRRAGREVGTHAAHDARPHGEHRLQPGGGGPGAGEPGPVQPLLSGEARLLPGERRHVRLPGCADPQLQDRIEPDQVQALPLAEDRPVAGPHPAAHRGRRASHRQAVRAHRDRLPGDADAIRRSHGPPRPVPRRELRGRAGAHAPGERLQRRRDVREPPADRGPGRAQLQPLVRRGRQPHALRRPDPVGLRRPHGRVGSHGRQPRRGHAAGGVARPAVGHVGAPQARRRRLRPGPRLRGPGGGAPSLCDGGRAPAGAQSQGVRGESLRGDGLLPEPERVPGEPDPLPRGGRELHGRRDPDLLRGRPVRAAVRAHAHRRSRGGAGPLRLARGHRQLLPLGQPHAVGHLFGHGRRFLRRHPPQRLCQHPPAAQPPPHVRRGRAAQRAGAGRPELQRRRLQRPHTLGTGRAHLPDGLRAVQPGHGRAHHERALQPDPRPALRPVHRLYRAAVPARTWSRSP